METLRYLSYQFWEDYGDSRITLFPLMHGGPWRVMGICGAYLLFVNVLGPRIMKNRQPFDLRAFMLIYNCFMIGFNGVGAVMALWITRWGILTWSCGRVDPNTNDMKLNALVQFGWFYFISKFADFMDTIFFVLRKKHNQATFLHIFHHSAMPLITYFGLKFHPSPFSSFLPTFNVFIHCVMYTYYALSASGPEMKHHLWWKKYITQLQMFQFITTFFHSCYGFITPDCSWPRWLAFLEGVHALIFFFMFYAFYRNAYGSKSIKAREQQKLKTG